MSARVSVSKSEFASPRQEMPTLPNPAIVLIAEHFVGHHFMDWCSLIAMHATCSSWREAIASGEASASVWDFTFRPPSDAALLCAVKCAPERGPHKVDLSKCPHITADGLAALSGKKAVRYLRLDTAGDCATGDDMLHAGVSFVESRAPEQYLHLVVSEHMDERWHRLAERNNISVMQQASRSGCALMCDMCDNAAAMSSVSEQAPLECFLCGGWFCGKCDLKSDQRCGKGIAECCDSNDDNADAWRSMGDCDECNKTKCIECADIGFCERCVKNICDDCRRIDYCEKCNTVNYCDKCHTSRCYDSPPRPPVSKWTSYMVLGAPKKKKEKEEDPEEEEEEEEEEAASTEAEEEEAATFSPRKRETLVLSPFHDVLQESDDEESRGDNGDGDGGAARQQYTELG
eukprot:g7382.t1